ncbi:nucleotidyltransferase family protein [Desulfopila aestuarii]|uniref:nucleotidyltransferase family protein n=1 Tax=Desulfopila aestuarii TaxID=231440 RepID=UPI00190EF7B4|nr:nucleotidyltransferase family protein [Desulfopila aestuarii]
MEKYGVQKIGFFRSVARGEQTLKSDIDIAIEMLPEKRNLQNFVALLRYIEKSLGAPVDLGIESTLKPAVKDSIQNEIIYV